MWVTRELSARSKLQVPRSKLQDWNLELGTWSLILFEDPAYFDDERVGWAGLGDEPVAAGACGALQLAGTVVRCQCDDRNVRGAVVGLQAARGLPAIEHGEAEIHQHDVGTMFGGVRDRVGAVGHLD